jgi:hypothetical protein
MDEDTHQRSLRSRPPADPVYRPRLVHPPATVALAGSTHMDRVRVHRPTAQTRFQTTNTTLRIAAVAVLALALGIGVVALRPSTNSVGSGPSPSTSPTPAPLVWSPASIEQDWPAPVREEPVGDPVVTSFAQGSLEYLDPQGDIESPDMPWIDIVRADQGDCSNPDGVCVEVAAAAPTEPVGPGDPWIAYGLVFDMDLDGLDGVADVMLGLDRITADMAVDHGLRRRRGDADIVNRAWKTDLRTGATEVGEAGDWICQCSSPAGDGHMKLYPGTYPTDDHADGRLDGRVLIPGRFYVWASEIQDGRVVATDYAPDTGWLEVSRRTTGPSR